MTARLPGPVCLFLNALHIDPGTLCRSASPVPGPAGVRAPKPPRIYSEHRGVVKNPLSYVGKDLILNDQDPASAQCVELVKKLAHAPRTGDDNWQKGEPLTEANVTSLEPGTPVASGWNSAGFYPRNTTGQHAGIFAEPAKDAKGAVIGFTIVEQYSTAESIMKRIVYFDPVAAKKPNTYFYRAGAYATIKW